MLFNDAYFFLPLLSGCKESHFYSLPFGKLKLTLSPNIFSTSPKNVFDEQNWSHSSFFFWNFTKNFTCPLGKLRTEFTSPIAKSSSPGLSDTTFFARWLCIKIEGQKIVLILVYCNTDFLVCLQINCLITKRPKHFQFLTLFFFLTGTHWFWTGTSDFSRDESQDQNKFF